MKTKINLFIVITLFLLPMLIASPGTYQQNKPAELTQTCDNGASICDSCNISIVKTPNETIVLNVVMTKRVSDFNYTLPTSYTRVLGEYTISGVCIAGAEIKTWNYDITIIPTQGIEDNTTIFIFLGIVAVILLLIAFLLRNNIFSFLSGLLFMGAGVYGMIYGFGSITNVYTQMLSYVIIGFGMIVTIISSIDFINEMELGGRPDTEESD